MVIPYPIPQDIALAGCGITTTAYTNVWIILDATNNLIKLAAKNIFGFVYMYPNEATKKNGMFSKSLRWALKNISLR